MATLRAFHHEIPTMNRMSARRSALAVAALLTLVGLPGCLPRGVVWLPDSSGIVFTDMEHARLVCYDLTRKARKILVDDTKSKTTWPAISADGKRLAVARVVDSTEMGSKVETTRTEVIIYDIRGQELKRSRPLITTGQLGNPATESKATLMEAGLNWSGPAAKLLLENAIYDCELDEWTKLDVKVMPFTNAPVRPDGKGFLAMGPKTLVFVDWDGWVTEFAGDLLPTNPDSRILAFEWDDKVARLTSSEFDFCRYFGFP
jgi:hypothetical protein